MNRQQGLTLIELLIAISLTVLIAALAYRFLDTAAQVEAQADENLTRLMALEQFFAVMVSDLEHSVDRQVVKPAVGIDPLAALMASGDNRLRPALLTTTVAGQPLSLLTGREGSLLWLTRQGWINPQQDVRSELQRVLYRMDNNGQLWRDYWAERNQSLSAPPQGSRLLLDDVQAFELAYLPAGTDPMAGDWLTEWPLPQPVSADSTAAVPTQRLPAALRVSLQSATLGRIERTFLFKGV